MDQNILQTVKQSAIYLLKQHEPETDVYAEEIMRTQGEEANEGKDPWYFVEVIPTSFTTMGPDQTEVAVTVAIDYHDSEECIWKYGEKAIELDRVFRPVFPFEYEGEQRRVTVTRLQSNISGRLLHLTFPLTFLVSDEPEEVPVIEELQTEMKRG